MKETMPKRIALAMLLAIQVLGGGAITLAHARDVVAAPPGVEASHTARCAILHDELRCALCHYANARDRKSRRVGKECRSRWSAHREKKKERDRELCHV